jgi:thymidylate synthase
LKEYVAQELGAEDGRIVAASKGCHIYSHAIQVAAERCNMTKVGTLDDLTKWHEKQKND